MNPYRQLIELLPKNPLVVGTVIAVHSDGTVTVEYPGGGQQRARAEGYAVADVVFVQGGEVRGPAPALTAITINV